MITKNGKPLNLMFSKPMKKVYFNNYKFTVCPSGRRSAKTHHGFNWSILNLIQGKKGLWVDTVQSNLDRYIKRYVYPTLIKNIKKKYWKYQASQKILSICDGYMDLRSAQYPENIEGFGYDFIVCNESGIIFKGQKGRNLWQQSILPMTTDYNAIVKLIGTPKGKKAKKDEKSISGVKTSLYYEMAEKGNSPDHEDWITYTYSSYDNPLISKEKVDIMAKEIPPIIRKQEVFGKFLDLSGKPIFRKNWFNIVDTLPPRKTWHRLIMSADTAFKAGSENDDSAIVTILETSIGYYIVHVWCKKVEFPELALETKKIHNYYCNKVKRIDYILIEDKASGQSLVQVFKKGTKLNIKGINPDSDKFTRANAITPICDSYNVILLKGGWNDMFLEQLSEFNELMDTPDDMVDAFTQGINWLVDNTIRLAA